MSSDVRELPVEGVENGFGCGHHGVTPTYHGTSDEVEPVLADLSEGDLHRSQLRGSHRPEIEGKARCERLQGPQGRLPHQAGAVDGVAIAFGSTGVAIVQRAQGYLDNRLSTEEALIDGR